jgi:hypothetical protein
MQRQRAPWAASGGGGSGTRAPAAAANRLGFRARCVRDADATRLAQRHAYALVAFILGLDFPLGIPANFASVLWSLGKDRAVGCWVAVPAPLLCK